MMAGMSRLMLLDSAAMYFRAFFGVPDRFTGADGTPVNAVRGFVDAIARVVAEFHPDELVACWDDDWRPQFRVDLVPSYKSHRIAAEQPAPELVAEDVPDRLQIQEPVIAAVLAAVGIPRVGAAGFEADDVIAQLARDHAGPVDIVTGDRDLFQLVSDDRGVRVVYTGRGMNRLEVVTDDWLRAKYGVTGAGYGDLAVLRGDASDGLPGVAGIGEKTAAGLVDRFGDLDGILAAAADTGSPMAPGVRRNLLAAGDYLPSAAQVVLLRHQVPVPGGPFPVPQSPADPESFVDLVDRYALNSPATRLLAALGGDG